MKTIFLLGTCLLLLIGISGKAQVDEVWVKLNQFIAKPFEFGFEFPSDVFGFTDRWIAGNGLGFTSAQGLDLISWWPKLEDVSSVELWMKPPDHVDEGRVRLAVELVDVVVVDGGEAKGSGLVEHTEEFNPACAHKSNAELLFLLALSFAEETNWFHSHASAPSLA